MSTIDALGGTTSATTGTASRTGTTEEAQDRFLKLLVNQMKNQDPLNPLDNAQVTSQLAQISTVSGIDKLNTTMAAMSDSLVSAQSLQAASMLGRHVVASGNTVEFEGSPVPMGFSLDFASPSATILVKDESGSVVFSESVADLPEGRQAFLWNGDTDTGGRAPSGVYTFEMQAVDPSGVSRKVASTYGYARVESVSLSGGVTANTQGLGAVPFATIEEVV